MKNLRHILLTAFAALGIASCTDILDKEPLDMISDATVWKDPVLMDAYLAQQYDFTPVLVQDANECITGSWTLPSVSATTDFNAAIYRSDKLGGQFADHGHFRRGHGRRTERSRKLQMERPDHRRRPDHRLLRTAL